MNSVLDVANYFLKLDEIKEGEGISNMKIQKLAYYAQGFHLALFDEPLFGESIEAWRHGPVVPDLYHHFKDNGNNHIPVPCDSWTNPLSPDQKELLDEIYDIFGQFSAWKLRNLTHSEAPWSAHELFASTIPHEDLKSYFKTQLN